MNLTYEHLIEESKSSSVESNFFLYQLCYEHELRVLALNSKGIDEILNYPKDFKFVAVKYDFSIGPILLPLVKHFNNPPVIASTAFVNPPYTLEYVGHKYPAYIPQFSTKTKL